MPKKKKTYGSFDEAIYADRVRRFKSRQQGLGEQVSFIAGEMYVRPFRKIGKGILDAFRGVGKSAKRQGY